MRPGRKYIGLIAVRLLRPFIGLPLRELILPQNFLSAGVIHANLEIKGVGPRE